MADIEEILSIAKLPEQPVYLCMRGDLQAEFEDLERALLAARERPADSLVGDGGEARRIAQQMETLQEQMRAYERKFVMRALTAHDYNDLTAKHPPTVEQKADGVRDVNWDTFPAALISACCVDPKMTAEQTGRLYDTITNRQFEQLFESAHNLNRRDVAVPKSLLASATLRTTEPTSKPPARGASRGGDSSAGNPRRSPRTSTTKKGGSPRA